MMKATRIVIIFILFSFKINFALAQQHAVAEVSGIKIERLNKRTDLYKPQEDGKITNLSKLYTVLGFAEDSPDRQKPLILVFYPGPDKCNSSGSATRSLIKTWYRTLERKTNRLSGTKPLYICKNFLGLDKYAGILNWQIDPNQVVEKLFFTSHYNCSSFVVINTNGDYISGFGEFPKETVWAAINKLTN